MSFLQPFAMNWRIGIVDSKQFLEVFSGVKLNKELEIAFTDVQVEKISMNKEDTQLKVCISSNHLIDNAHILRCESALKKSCSDDPNLTVKILQKYNLSDSYDLQTLMRVYGDSIRDELKDYDHIIASAFRQAKLSYEDERTCVITLADTRTNRLGEEKLKDILNRIVTVRCGIDAVFRVEYDMDMVGTHKAADDAIIERRIQEIAARAGIRTGVYDDKSNQLIAEAKDSSEHQQNNTADISASKDDKKDLAKLNIRPLKRSDNPDVYVGSEFDGDITSILDIIGEIGEVIIRGQVSKVEVKPIKNEKTIYFFDITDFTDTIGMKVFVHNEQLPEISSNIHEGAFVKVKGTVATDTFSKSRDLTIDKITGVMKIADFREPRIDLSERKRVELHCHTKMSDMDGVSNASDLVKCAHKWGHKALAITDHGVVQGYPEAFHTWEKLEDPDFKIIYGMEAYIVDDSAKVAYGDMNLSLDSEFVVFDIETTGFSAVHNKIIEIGAVKVRGTEIIDRFSTFVDPKEPIPHRITALTSIDDSMVRGQETIEQVLPKFLDFARGCVLVAHNAGFDTSFIREACKRQELEYDFSHVDTVELSRVLLPHLANYKLHTVAKDLGVSLQHHHRAVDDAECTAHIFINELKQVKEKGCEVIGDTNGLEGNLVDKVKKMRQHHAIILAKNDTGRVNLYTLVSESHLTFFSKQRPCIPKSLIEEYREGLILGSACEAGELFRAILDDRPDEEIARIVDFYDYLEVQPIGNNEFLIRDEKHPDINNEEDLRDLNRKIVELGDRFGKPVVATCDVHFLNPEDEVYRRILMAGKGFADADNQAPLYLRTTEEMLQEFMYLGYEKAYEIVVENTNKIADMIDVIKPVRPDKCPPVIEDSDKTLREICTNKAKEMYGDPLPEIVSERLERELHSIISNGFAVMYIIAQKLVWKSMEDGYLVGSRGSVGSSFVATMAGITEVNPLPQHYYCPSCHYSDFDSDEVKAFVGKAGVDMPDKNCPICGSKLEKDGFDIPFETFLGFKGDKEPDIDLNFSGEYQSRAHKYTEVIFGKGQTFRAGTIASLAEKTAFGFIKKYYEERGVHKRECEINRLVQGCTGVRRSTGQHPGGIVVLPKGENINSFTPVQHPANDMTTDTITTHFDYHSIDHNLLKLDILGHDDPTMIRMLQDLTGLDPVGIPLDDPGVMSLFKNTERLGITPDDIDGVPLGCLGIPEFGTDFAMGMLIDTKPQYFSDLVRIAGLAHGTDVWLGNAEKLIKEGTATISTAICTRDDIMTYLIQMGVESSQAFSIMENVRKGNVAKGKCDKWAVWKEDMLAHGVPEWYTWSCEHIQYMFPKAHAAAYVMMAWRVAYYKINYPLQYYASFYTIRATAFNYATMCMGEDALRANLKAAQDTIKRKKDEHQKPTSKEEDTVRDMRIVLEMYARGYDFMPIDLRLVHPSKFQVIDGKVMPSLTSIDGLGDKAAELIAEGGRSGDFLSKEDFRNRTKASATITDTMVELGILENLPETNQLSIFEIMGMEA